jgi:hypothetical protein
LYAGINSRRSNAGLAVKEVMGRREVVCETNRTMKDGRGQVIIPNDQLLGGLDTVDEGFDQAIDQYGSVGINMVGVL